MTRHSMIGVSRLMAWDRMLRAGYLAVLVAVSGSIGACSQNSKPVSPSGLEDPIRPLLPLTDCVGLTIGEAVAQLGLQGAELEVGSEPPLIARSLHAYLPLGESIVFYIARQDPNCEGQLHRERWWTIEDIANATVVGVRYLGPDAIVDIDEIPVGLQVPLPDHCIYVTRKR